MNILVDGEVKTLEIIDQDTGCNWEQDLIGDCDGLTSFDESSGLYVMSVEDYEWWAAFIKVEQIMCDRISKIKLTLTPKARGEFDADIEALGAGEMLVEQTNIVRYLNSITTKN